MYARLKLRTESLQRGTRTGRRTIISVIDELKSTTPLEALNGSNNCHIFVIIIMWRENSLEKSIMLRMGGDTIVTVANRKQWPTSSAASYLMSLAPLGDLITITERAIKGLYPEVAICRVMGMREEVDCACLPDNLLYQDSVHWLFVDDGVSLHHFI